MLNIGTVSRCSKYFPRNTISRKQIKLITISFIKYLLVSSLFVHRAPIWGLLRNGSYDGVLGMFQKNQIEISISPFRITRDRIDLVDFTVVTWVTTSTIIFRHPQQSGLKNIFFQPLTTVVWQLIFILVLVVSVLITISMKHNSHQGINMTIVRAFILSLGILCQQGIIENVKKISVRVYFYVLILFSLIIYQFYSSFIVSSLLTESPKTINTIRQLIDSKLGVGIEDITYNFDFFQTTNDPIVKELFKKKIEMYHNYFDVNHGLQLMKEGGFAFHVDTSYAYRLIRESFSEEEICELHEMLLFPIRPLLVTVAKDSPFREFLTIALQRLIEKGIVDHQTRNWSELKPKCERSITKIKAVDIDQASPILILLAVATILSFLILSCEILYYKFNCIVIK